MSHCRPGRKPVVTRKAMDVMLVELGHGQVVSLSNTRMEVLLGLLDAGYSGIRHDLADSITGSLWHVRWILNSMDQAGPRSDQIRRPPEAVLDALRDADHHLSRIDAITRDLATWRGQEGRLAGLLVTPMDWLFQSLAELYPNVSYDLESIPDPPGAALYPRATLRFATREIMYNARAHSGKEVDVSVRASLSDGRLTLEVHDSGPGIASTLGSTYVHLGMLDALKKGGGLMLVARVVAASHGKLLFRRSPRLGGTEVMMEFMLPAVSSGGALVEHWGIYGVE